MLCRMRVGVEVGGTFTDLVAIEDGRIRTAKVPSTPSAPEQGAFAALRAWNGAIDAVVELAHGSTVATNAVLERKGARIALWVTHGMRDVLRLQRHNRRSIYDLHYAKPAPLVERRDTFEIAERIDSAGGVVTELDEAGIKDLAGQLKGSNYDVLAIAFLNSYANPEHERRAASLAREFGWCGPITCSHEVIPVFREYERFSTTAMAAYVQPVVSAYLERFEHQLESSGFRGNFSVMQSNGGRLPAHAMGRNAITALFSGPAAGVVGAAHQAGRSGYTHIITFDMGGTSTDVCLVENGRPQLVGETEVDGLPVKTPVLDIVTVGAGGGSLVWVDDGGLLRVGPRSAGAEPGPACYGRGGTLATVSDAHVTRGTIRAESFLGGEMMLDVGAAKQAFSPIAEQLSVPLEEAADAAIRVAQSNIVRAIQRISTERGKDPRGYTLVPFGGAGPMQAVRVAEELGLARVVVPPYAGVLSALGLLAADYVHYESQTHKLPVDEDSIPQLTRIVEDLKGRVHGFFADLGLPGEVTYLFTFEMRYVTQAFEIAVELDEADATAPSVEKLRASFHSAHEKLFEFAGELDQPCEIVSIRVGGSVPPSDVPYPSSAVATTSRPFGKVQIFEGGQKVSATVIPRANLEGTVHGPVIMEDETSTIYVPQHWQCWHDEAHNLVIESVQR